MHPKAVRRFTIADGMILVVAAALGAVFLRSYLPGFYRLQLIRSSQLQDPWGVLRPYFWLSGIGSCAVVPTMMAVIVMRLRQPRPGRIRLASQPGFVACLAVAASLVPGLIWYATIAHRLGLGWPNGFEQAWSIMNHWNGAAVLGAWLALALARRWRPERLWIDRLGRVLGAYWLVLLVWMIAYDWLQKIMILLSGRGA